MITVDDHLRRLPEKSVRRSCGHQRAIRAACGRHHGQPSTFRGGSFHLCKRLLEAERKIIKTVSHTLSACLTRLARPLPMHHTLMGSPSLPEQYNERRQLPGKDQHVTFPSSLPVNASTRRNLKQPGWDHRSTAALPPYPDGNPSRKSSMAGRVNKATTLAVNRQNRLENCDDQEGPKGLG